MITPEQFDHWIDVLIKRGYPEQKAIELANAIGDEVQEDDDGKWVAYDEEDNVIARIDPIY